MTIVSDPQSKVLKSSIQQSELPGFIDDTKTPKISYNLGKTGIVRNVSVFDHTSFTRKLVERHTHSLKRKEDLINRIETIEKRARDPCLYLAVVGEFNCGKSTFINGMLRQRLLKSACVATTASVTHIKPGKKFVVTANFVDGTIIKATKDDFSNLERKLHKVNPVSHSNIDLNYLLELLTSEKAVANTVKRIDIEVPSAHLMDNVSIIDTPGINPGATYADSHEKVTQDVMDNVADAAIILISSESPVTATLIHFLKTTAKHFLHRCIFVVTAMDRKDESERNEIVNHIKFQLADKLNISNPIVLQSSAIAMINVNNRPSLIQSYEYWQNQFEQLEATIKRVMVKQREIIIAESLVRLLQELMKELDEDLNTKKKELTQEQVLLKKSDIKTIENLLDRLYSESEKRVNAEITILKSYIKSKKFSYCASAKKEVEKIIKGEGSIISYETEIAPNVKITVEKVGKSFLLDVNNEMGSLRKACSNICYNFEKQFKANYSNFPFLGADITVPSLSFSSISVPELKFESSKDYIDRQNSEDDKGAAKGALGGALAGFFVGGPIGAIGGLLIGGIGGLINAGDSTDERRNKVCAFVNNDIDAFFDKYSKKIEKDLEGISTSILKQLKDAGRHHITEYSSAVKELIMMHKNEESRLNTEITLINQDLLELLTHKEKLDDVKIHLLMK